MTTLWIVTPTLSQNILAVFDAQAREDWGQGIYFLPGNSRSRILVVHQLPVLSINYLSIKIPYG